MSTAVATAAASGPGASAVAAASTEDDNLQTSFTPNYQNPAVSQKSMSTSLEFVDVEISAEPFVQSSLQTIMDITAAAYPQYKQGMNFYGQPEKNTLVYPERWARMLPNLDFSSADALLESLVSGQKYLAVATDKNKNFVFVITATSIIDGGLNSAYTVWGYSFTPSGMTELPPVEVRRNRLGQMVYFEPGPSTL
jgi:hypothetical protein